jgi:hypothetical protein
MPEIPVEILLSTFDYDPESGLLIARLKTKRGKSLGWLDEDGYVRVAVYWNGKRYLRRAHRLIWAMVTGEYPVEEIDHWNGVKADNRWDNLREATRGNNQHNRVRGEFVGTHLRKGKWQARINVDGKRINLGNFKTREEAHEAYLQARERLVPFQPKLRRA